MEGIAGIEDQGDCLPSHPAAYARGRTLMTDEVLVAIEALRGAQRRLGSVLATPVMRSKERRWLAPSRQRSDAAPK